MSDKMTGALAEAMEELHLLGAIDALKGVLECRFESGGEGCKVVDVADIQEQLENRQRDLLRIRTSRK